MPTPLLLRGRLASIAIVALWLCATSGGQAQDILNELEQDEHDSARPHGEHNRDHDSVPGTKQKGTAKENDEHRGHKHTTFREKNNKPRAHKHAVPGDSKRHG